MAENLEGLKQEVYVRLQQDEQPNLNSDSLATVLNVPHQAVVSAGKALEATEVASLHQFDVSTLVLTNDGSRMLHARHMPECDCARSMLSSPVPMRSASQHPAFKQARFTCRTTCATG